MPIRAVIFDIGGVIQPSPIPMISAHSAALGIPDCNRFLAASTAWNEFMKGRVGLDEFAEAVEIEAKADPDGRFPDGIGGRELLAILYRAGASIRPEMKALISRLRSRGITIAALTNNFPDPPRHSDPEVQRAHEAFTAELKGLFDVWVESAASGLIKPDPRIYELALRRLSVAPREAIFVDDLGVNLKGARAVGLHTVKVNNGTATEYLEAIPRIEVVAAGASHSQL